MSVVNESTSEHFDPQCMNASLSGQQGADHDDQQISGENMIGVVIAIIANSIIPIGLNLQKFAHTRNTNADGRPIKPITKIPVWWVGLLSMAGGEIFNLLAYGYSPTSLVAPVGAIGVLVNALIATLCMKETFGLKDGVGLLAIATGVVMVVTTVPEVQLDIRHSPPAHHPCERRLHPKNLQEPFETCLLPPHHTSVWRPFVHAMSPIGARAVAIQVWIATRASPAQTARRCRCCSAPRGNPPAWAGVVLHATPCATLFSCLVVGCLSVRRGGRLGGGHSARAVTIQAARNAPHVAREACRVESSRGGYWRAPDCTRGGDRGVGTCRLASLCVCFGSRHNCAKGTTWTLSELFVLSVLLPGCLLGHSCVCVSCAGSADMCDAERESWARCMCDER